MSLWARTENTEINVEKSHPRNVNRLMWIGAFLVAMIVVGYQIGKHMAFRDNAAERAAIKQT